MIDQPLNTYTKQPVPGLPTAGVGMPGAAPDMGANMTFSPMKQNSKRNRRTMAMVLGVLAFLILAVSGVWIAFRSGLNPLAPNAPESRPGAASAVSCTLSFDVAGIASPTPSPSTIPSPSPTPSPTPGVSPSPTPSPSIYSCNSTCDTDSQCQTANADYVCSSAQGNNCRLLTNVSSATCTPATGTYACNSTCTDNSQCASANADYICASVDNGNFCRLSTATSASNCQLPQPTPTPTIGCNQTCVSNSDCANPDHICYNNTCRLQTNPTNQYCAPPTVAVTPTPVVPGSTPQPTLPTQLPSSGVADWGNAVKAGVATLGIGALLLLFL